MYYYKVPALSTVKRYGWTLQDFDARVQFQKGVCPVCKLPPKDGKFVIDHYHVKGWKKMPPEKRKLYVRGLLCSFDNYRMIPRGMTATRALNIWKYLSDYAKRQPQGK